MEKYETVFPYFRIFKDVPKTFVPMLWFKQEANLTASYAGQARMLTLLPTAGYIAITVINVVALVLILAAIIIYFKDRNHGIEGRLLLSEDDGELSIPTQS